jgi:hypothetical protein
MASMAFAFDMYQKLEYGCRELFVRAIQFMVSLTCRWTFKEIASNCPFIRLLTHALTSTITIHKGPSPARKTHRVFRIRSMVSLLSIFRRILDRVVFIEEAKFR